MLNFIKLLFPFILKNILIILISSIETINKINVLMNAHDSHYIMTVST